MDSTNSGERKSYKVIVLGEAGVGKSSLIRRYTHGYFSSQTTTTVGVDRVPIKVKIEDDLLDFQVLDTAGCFAFHGLIKSYVNNVDAVIFVYDLTNKETFACLPLWNSIMKSSRRRDFVQILVGNKRDLDIHREVNFKNAKHYAEFEGMVAMEMSVKDEESVDLVFQCVARELRMRSERIKLKNVLEKNMDIRFPSRPRSVAGYIGEEEEEEETKSRHFAQRFRLMFNNKGQRKTLSYSKSDSMLSLPTKPVDDDCTGTGYIRANYLRWF